MKLFIVISLFSCITIATCFECKMSPCEGTLRSGASICAEYELGQYTGMINGRGCSWDTTKVECCKKTPSAEGCKWSNTCWRLNHSHESVCNKEFGDGFRPSEKLTCGTLARRTSVVLSKKQKLNLTIDPPKLLELVQKLTKIR